jgi:UDP-2,3-diacylglucosamine pyrophosphatase LpxH
MHLFVSDIHITDGTIGESVSDEVLTTRLLGQIDGLESPTTLVFLGDIFELLRSSEWALLWKPDSQLAPWTNMGEGFQNFPPRAAKAAHNVLGRIIARFPKFAAALKALVSSGKVQTHYIPGNHDYMVQLSEDARKLVVDFLSLRNVNLQDPFRMHYADDNAEIFAVHGHKADPLNWHDGPTGRWAFGDVIVLRIVNRFITEACGKAGSDPSLPETPISQAFQDMDNVQPTSDLALYFRHVLERNLTNPRQREEVLRIWTEAVDGALAIEAFSDDTLYGDRTHKFMRYALELSKKQTLAALVPALREKYEGFFKGEDPYLAEAQRLFDSYDGTYRYILFGHTHRPLVTQLSSSFNKAAYYINTGCWRRLVVRGSHGNQFRPADVRSWVHVDGSDRPFRYRLLREFETQ